jgi:hypothetical protein
MSDLNNTKTENDLKREKFKQEEAKKLAKGIAYMSSCQDWVKHHETLRIFAGTVASAGHGHFSKQQLESANGFLQTFCDRFGCLTLRMVESMIFSAEYAERQPDYSEEDKQMCKKTRDLCIQQLKKYKLHGDKDYCSIVVKKVIPYVEDKETLDILCQKINTKLPKNYMRSLDHCGEPLDAYHFQKAKPNMGSNTEYEG